MVSFRSEWFKPSLQVRKDRSHIVYIRLWRMWLLLLSSWDIFHCKVATAAAWHAERPIESMTTFPCVWSSEHLRQIFGFSSPTRTTTTHPESLFKISVWRKIKHCFALFPLTAHDCELAPLCLYLSWKIKTHLPPGSPFPRHLCLDSLESHGHIAPFFSFSPSTSYSG